MKRIYLCVLLVALALLSGCASGGVQPPEHAFRYAENQASDFPTTLAAYYFADRVYELSDGRIKICVYPNAELGDEFSVVEQMQFGGIDFGRVSLSTLSEYDNRLFVLQMPYLYRDRDHMWRVLDSEIGRMYLEGLSAIQIKGLAWVDAGARNFYTQKGPVTSLADMQGLRIRVQENALMERLVQLLGAEPVQMRYSEVLQALQTGKIDGAENNYPSYQSTGHYLVASYLLEDEHALIPEPIIASEAAMDRLSPEDRELIAIAVQEAALYQRELFQEYERLKRTQVIESGCEIFIMADTEKEAFMAATVELYQEFAGDSMDIIESIRGM